MQGHSCSGRTLVLSYHWKREELSQSPERPAKKARSSVASQRGHGRRAWPGKKRGDCGQGRGLGGRRALAGSLATRWPSRQTRRGPPLRRPLTEVRKGKRALSHTRRRSERFRGRTLRLVVVSIHIPVGRKIADVDGALLCLGPQERGDGRASAEGLLQLLQHRLRDDP